MALLCYLPCLMLWLCLMHRSLAIEVQLNPKISNNQGTVQIRFNSTSEWGTICDDKWGLPDANVICKMLGFSSATEAHTGAEFGQGEGPVWFDEVECNGNENSISDCQRLPGWGGNDCDHSEDAGVTCYQGPVTILPPPSTVANCNASTNMRIVDGPSSAVGRVEVRMQNDQWGTVCDDAFGYLEARVVCRALCFEDSHAKPYTESGSSISSANDSVTIYLDELACDGNEASLLDCSGQRNAHDCNHKEDALVSCINYSEAPPLPPSPEVICNADTMEVAFNRTVHSTLQENNVNVEEVMSECQQQKSINVSFISITLSYFSCTSTSETNGTHIIYSASIRYDLTSGNVIQRTFVYHLPVHCAIPREGEANRPFQPVTQTAPPQVALGSFDFDMLIYTDDDYKSPVSSYPFNVSLGSYLNVAVLLRSQDSQVKEIVPECWVTTTSNSSSEPFYPLISNKCPVDATVRIFPLNETMLGFRLQSLKFINFTYVYIHCSVFVCRVEEKTDVCDQVCQLNRRKRDIEEKDPLDITYLMQGPIYLIEDRPALEIDSTGGQEDLNGDSKEDTEKGSEPLSGGLTSTARAVPKVSLSLFLTLLCYTFLR